MKSKPTKQTRALAEELWLIGYTEKCRVNKVKPYMTFDDPEFPHAQKMGWLKIAEHILKRKTKCLA